MKFKLSDFKQAIFGFAEEKEPPEIQPFSQYDWYGFAGCARFKDRSEPLIAKGVTLRFEGRTLEGELVGDLHTIGFYAVEDDESTGGTTITSQGFTEHMYGMYFTDGLNRWIVETIMQRVLRECHSIDDLLKIGFQSL